MKSHFEETLLFIYLFIYLFIIGALKYAAISACYTLLVLILGKHSADCNVCSNSFRIADYALLGHVLKTVRSQTFEGCLFTCERDPRCFSVNFYAVRASCEMNLGTREAVLKRTLCQQEDLHT